MKNNENIIWAKKVKQSRNVNLKNCFVEVYVGGKESEGQDYITMFKFLKGCHKEITRTRYINIGYDKEENRFIFKECMPDVGYAINEYKGETENSTLQLRKKSYPEFYEIAERCGGTYQLQGNPHTGFYIQQTKKKQEVEEVVEEVDEEKVGTATDFLLKSINTMNYVSISIDCIGEYVKKLEEQNGLLLEILKQINSNLNKNTEKVTAIFTEVNYKNKWNGKGEINE